MLGVGMVLIAFGLCSFGFAVYTAIGSGMYEGAEDLHMILSNRGNILVGIFVVIGIILVISGIVMVKKSKNQNNNGNEAVSDSNCSSIILGAAIIGHYQTRVQDGKVTKVFVNTPDSVGGVDVQIRFRNHSGKVIKYAYFTLSAINRVGDVVLSDIEGQNDCIMQSTGPYHQGEICDSHWENVWYNNSISDMRIDKVKLEYMDGTEEEIDGNMLSRKNMSTGAEKLAMFFGAIVALGTIAFLGWIVYRFMNR